MTFVSATKFGIVLQSASSIVGGNLSTQGGSVTISGEVFASAKHKHSNHFNDYSRRKDRSKWRNEHRWYWWNAGFPLLSHPMARVWGSVSLADVVSDGVGINKLTINTGPNAGGGAAGEVTLADIRLIRDGSTPAALQINSALTTSPIISIDGVIDLMKVLQVLRVVRSI